MIETLLVNDSLTAGHNLTIPANLTIQVLIQNDRVSLYNSPLVSTLLGVIVGASATYFLNIRDLRNKEKKELAEYEYLLLSKVKEIIEDTNIVGKQEAKDLYYENFSNMKFYRLNSRKLIATTCSKYLKGEPVYSERDEIDKRLKELKK